MTAEVYRMILNYGFLCESIGWHLRWLETAVATRDTVLDRIEAKRQEAAELLEQIEAKVGRRDVDS